MSLKGISSSLETTPNPESMVLRLLMSVWFMAPMSGAVIK